MAAIHKVRHKIRRNTVIALLLGAAGGAALMMLLGILTDSLNHWIERHAVFLVEHHYLVLLMSLLVVSPLLLLSLILLRLANRVVSSQRFPPPRTTIIRHIQILKGQEAVRRGRLLQLLCWLIFLAAAGLPVVVWFMFYSISALN